VAALFRSWASRYLSRHTSQMAAINASARPPTDDAQQMPAHQRVHEAFFGRRLALR